MPQFILNILQAVCLGFVHIPDIGPIPLESLSKTNFNSVRLTWRLSLAKSLNELMSDESVCRTALATQRLLIIAGGLTMCSSSPSHTSQRPRFPRGYKEDPFSGT